MEKPMMKPFAVLAVVLAAAVSLVASDIADAKRLGGGGSLGAQRQSIAPRSAAPAPTQPGAASNPVMPAQPGAASAARPTTAPASGASRWLGPLAGIAAGIGLAALLSHFGLSESFASILLLALLAFGAIFLIRMLFARRSVAAAPQVGGRFPTTMDASGPVTHARFEPAWGGATNVAPTPTLPPGFNPGPFLQQAKAQFRHLQAAYDQDDRAALSDVMTPEMFAEVERDLDHRGAHVATEVVTLDADILEVVTEGRQHVASVRFTATMREDGAAQPTPVVEVWNLVKPVDGSSGWLLAGIQQPEAALTLQ
jgi:predicted lipid-binding transport protein (Tim44 family)